MKQLLLMRRLLEAAVDPQATRREADDVGAEMAEISARLSVAPGRLLADDSLEGLHADDFSPQAWLLLLDGRSEDQPDVPSEILETLYLQSDDPVTQFRLVSGALNQPRIRRAYAEIAASAFPIEGIEALPDSWPKSRIEALERLADSKDETFAHAAQAGLQLLVMYLLQEGSEPALALAEAAVAPPGWWRAAARQTAVAVTGNADPARTGYGRRFSRFQT